MNKNTNEIRQAFLDFFLENNHKIIKSSSLIPFNDSSLLFTNAGMNQFKNIFLGLHNYPYNKVATAQRCVRVGGKHNDIKNIGYTNKHHTFFEMLGNFSFGDYFKHEAIEFAWELLTSSKWFNLPKKKLWITVYEKDEESYNIWKNKIKGVFPNQVVRIGKKNNKEDYSDNFWKMGDIGPCGPSSEIFYDYGENMYGFPPGSNKEYGNRYIEIWNLVFIQYNQLSNRKLVPLLKNSVDTGMGLERIASVLQNVCSNYDTDIFSALISCIANKLSIQNIKNNSLKIIADHIRSCTFIISEGILPSNEGRGYVLRRIIRRAIYHGYKLGIYEFFFYKLVEPMINIMHSISHELKKKKKEIENIIKKEEIQFSYTIKKGLLSLNNEISSVNNKILSGKIAFCLYDTYGFPLDLTIDICRENNIVVDLRAFDYEMNIQKNRSKKSSQFMLNCTNFIHLNKNTKFVGYNKIIHNGKIIDLLCNNISFDKLKCGQKNGIIILNQTPFYGESGGQVGDSGILKSNSGIFKVLDTKKYNNSILHIGEVIEGTIHINEKVTSYVDESKRNKISANHSSIHLLHESLRKLFGKNIHQKGSFINENYLRFDFSYNKEINLKDIITLEKIINKQILLNHSIKSKIMYLEHAYEAGAISLLNKQYKKKVRTIKIGNFSLELCGGTHVTNTGNIGIFHIISNKYVSNGIYRIKAITGKKVLEILQKKTDLIKSISGLVKEKEENLFKKIEILKNKNNILEKNFKKLQYEKIIEECILLKKEIKGITIIIKKFDNIIKKILVLVIKELNIRIKSSIIVLVNVNKKEINLVTSVTKNINKQINAKEIVNLFIKITEGKGGGNKEFAQAGTNKKISSVSILLTKINKLILQRI